MILLICVLIVAVIVDMISYRIPNMCITVGIITGLIRAYSLYGEQGVLEALQLVFVVFTIGYPLYLMRGFGAGDVKLMMVVACFLSSNDLQMCAVATMLIAGVIAVVKVMIYKKNKEKWIIRMSVPILCSVLLQIGGAW